jgi:ABC-type transport system substrate-binding protein
MGRDGANYGSYDNPLFDAQLDTALRSEGEVARQAFTRAFSTINADAPAIWLYEPLTVIGIHRRIRTAEMRPDAWWMDLGKWRIAAADRLLRDRTRP